MARAGKTGGMMFDRIAAALVASWFAAGVWLVVQSVLLPRRPPAVGEPDCE